MNTYAWDREQVESKCFWKCEILPYDAIYPYIFYPHIQKMVTCDSPGHVIFSFIGHIRFVQRAARWPESQSYAAIEKDESPFKPYCSSSSGLTAVKAFEIAGVFFDGDGDK